MRIYVDATTLIALGTVDELDLLHCFDGNIVIPPAVREEVTTEPARSALTRFYERDGSNKSEKPDATTIEDARSILGDDEVTGDVQLVAAILERDGNVAIVSDDRRVRTVARGLGARVTGTIGVVVRAVEEGLPATDANALVDRIDDHGLHMTGELRATDYTLNENADGTDE